MLEEKLQILRNRYPGLLVYKILVFGTPGQDALVGSKHIIPILSSRISTVTSLGTVMCDITTDLLSELGALFISRQLGPFKSPGLKELEQQGSWNATFKASISENASGLQSPTGSISSASGRTGTKFGSISLGLSDRTKAKQKGRLLKYQANLFLLSGRWSDALRDFSEAATVLKSAHDHLWFASALEGIGICLVLLSFLEVPISIPAIALSVTSHQGLDTPSDTLSPITSNSSMSGILVPPSLFEFIPELSSRLLRFYVRSQGTPEDSVPQIVYCETILRTANILAITRLAGGWNPASLSAIVRGTAVINNITTESPSVSIITKWCNQAFATELANLPLADQAHIYCGIASIYSNIGLMRKRSFVLRDLLTIVVSKMSKRNKVGDVTGTLENFPEEGIVSLLDTICNVYGAGNIRSIGYGWEELRLSFLKLSLSVCESLLDYAGIVYFAGLLLSTSTDILSFNDQIRIYTIITNAAKSARQRGVPRISTPYWDSNLVRDVIIIPTNTSIAPRYIKPGSAATSDVFIHNPYAAKRNIGTKSETQIDPDTAVIVQNERAELIVKLQNPFAFEIKILELSLITENIKMRSSAKNFFIPPRSIYELKLPSEPLGAGSLKILGAKIQVEGCELQEFEMKTSQPWLQENRIKHSGVNSSVLDGMLPAVRRTLDINVIAAQPVMVLKDVSLTQGWMMILEGERKSFTFTLANISEVEANHVQLHFSDATTEPLKLSLSNKELPWNEKYEIEYFLYKRQALRWRKNLEGGNTVAPNKSATYTIDVLGKRGMTDGIVQVEYSNREAIEPRMPYWSRILAVPINVTVNTSIELGACDIIPLQHDMKVVDIPGKNTLGPYMERIKSKDSLGEYCMLVLDLRNSWSNTMEIKLWSSPTLNNEDGETLPDPDDPELFRVSAAINAGKTSRFLIPVKRVEFTAEELDRPIPTLSNRQFVVESNTTAEKQRQMQETFWYRDAMLKMLGGSWSEIGSDGALLPDGRTGALELRGIRLSSKMTSILNYENVRITMEASIDQHLNGVLSTDRRISATHTNSFRVVAEQDFVTLSITIANHTASHISGFLRIIPSERYGVSTTDNDPQPPSSESQWSSIDNRIMYNGTLQQPIIDIGPNASHALQLGVVFLSRGEYKWISIFEETGEDPTLRKTHIQRDAFFINAE